MSTCTALSIEHFLAGGFDLRQHLADHLQLSREELERRLPQATEALAAAFDTPLQERPEVWADIQAKLSGRGRPIAASNRRQALLPEGAALLPNPTGTAPGDEGSSIPNDAAGWASYDLVFLGDVPATVLDAGRQASLVEAVMSHGVGLVLQPGVDHLPRDYTGSPLATLFPVVVDAATGDGADLV